MENSKLEKEELEKLLKNFKNNHSQKYNLKQFGYFGSYARNEANKDSDIDIFFTTDKPNLLITATLKQDLEDLLQHRVDIIRLRDKMNPSLKKKIEQEAKYV